MRQRQFALAFLLATAISPATAQERPDDGSIYNGGGAYTTVVGALKGIWAKLTSGVNVTCTSGCGTPATPALSSNTPASLAVTNATARVAFADNTTTFPAANLLNDGAAELFFALGNGAVTAATSNQALPAGRSICVAIGASLDVAAITAAGTTTLTVKQASACPPESGGGGSGGGGGAVTVADGADVTLGAKADAANAAVGNTLMAATRQLHADMIAAIPAGTNIIGKTTTDQTTPGTTDLVHAKVCDTATPTNCATVNPASTAAVAGNLSVAVQLTPNSPGITPPGPAAAANSIPMTIGPALLGSYCMGANTGTMAAGLAANSPIYSFRYGGANLAIIRKIEVEADDITTAFVAGAAKLDLIAARSFSASDTGGTAATLTGNNGKMRTSFVTTAISDLRISSTATLAAGTRTLDAQPLASVEFAVPTSIDAGLLPTTPLIRTNVGESPLVLANNEGFVIQATVPGTGTWVLSARTCWDEVTAF